MNGKIAKLLRKVSSRFEHPERRTKDMWKATPRNKKGALHKNLKKELSEE